MFPSPMQNPEDVPTHQHLQLGLKALMAISEKETPHKLNAGSGIVHSYKILSASASASLSKSSSWSSSSSSFNSSLPSLPRFLSYPSSVMGDLIGTESGVYMSPYEDLVTAAVEKSKPYNNGRQNKGSQEPATKRKYPPPIPLLAGTGNLVAHMPWVLTRRYTNDGKLILTEERGKYQEYFEDKREHGRLLLSLVSLDNANGHPHTVDDKDEQVEEEDLYFMEGVPGATEKYTETELIDFDIYDDESCDDENGKQPTKMVDGIATQKGSMTTLASSMPEIPPVKMMHEKSRFGRRCLTFVDRGSSDSSNMFGPMLDNIIYT